MTSHWADWLPRERRSKRMNSHLDVTLTHTYGYFVPSTSQRKEREKIWFRSQTHKKNKPLLQLIRTLRHADDAVIRASCQRCNKKKMTNTKNRSSQTQNMHNISAFQQKKNPQLQVEVVYTFYRKETQTCHYLEYHSTQVLSFVTGQKQFSVKGRTTIKQQAYQAKLMSKKVQHS